MIDISRTLFIVDGQTEAKALVQAFAMRDIFKVNRRILKCNGKSVSPEGYANAAYGILCTALTDCYTRVVCILDKESRKTTAPNMCKKFRNAILKSFPATSRNDLEEKLSLCVADIMFENWIVADVEGIKQSDLVDKDTVQDVFEGRSGATALNRMMKERYQKTIHGPKLFSHVRPTIGCMNSQSFSLFCKIIDMS